MQKNYIASRACLSNKLNKKIDKNRSKSYSLFGGGSGVRYKKEQRTAGHIATSQAGEIGYLHI